jgi:ribonucleotide reductase beta subunit family protein with ferritin-like domain
MEVIFLIRRLIERYQKYNNDLHIIFIDLEKVYDEISKNIIWWAFQKK